MLKSNYMSGGRWYEHEYKAILINAYYKSASHRERKFACAHPQYVRAKRNHKNLINSYDDYEPSRVVVTSWKDKTKHRKQWMH